MPSDAVIMSLNIDCDPEADLEERERLALQLRRELLELDIDSAEHDTSGSIPEGAKAGDAFTLGTLILTMAASGGVLTALINTVQTWLTRTEARGVSLEINGDKLEIKGISSEEQNRLVNLWLARHTER